MPELEEYCSSKQNHCYVTKAKEGGIYLEVSYNPEFLQAIKDHVPKDHRIWDPLKRRWWVSDRYARQAVIDANAFFKEVQEV